MQSIRFACALAIAIASTGSAAGLKVAAIFGDNMVLQQQQPVRVWGWADASATVTVNFSGQVKSACTAADGRWQVTLDPMIASFTPQSLTVLAGETKTFTNILVGEVWLASGQSNMEKPIGVQKNQKPTFNAEAELAAAKFPNIRIFKIEKTLAEAPKTDVEKFQGWSECNSNSLDTISFSAAAYFFGREIHTNLNVPVGLVESSWGGTRIEPWTPPAGFKLVSSQKKFAALPVKPDGTNKISNTRPKAIYNAMIAPIAGFTLRGALWYQGESNLMGTNADNDYRDYADKMAALVGGWRAEWGQGNFPFYFVQIAPFKYFGAKTRRANSPEQLAEFWALQSLAARRIENAGMAVTTDLVDNLDDIHPRNKADVGHRLALLALEKTYGRPLESSGPVFRRVKVTGGKAVVEFDHAAGLASRDGQPLTWFTIAGRDGKFSPAAAKIVDGKVELTAAEVSAPRFVRFAWHETAQPNLVNAAGLPAEPFEARVRHWWWAF